MARYKNYLNSDRSLANNLVRDSRSLFDKEHLEERIDYKLALLLENIQKGVAIDKSTIKQTIQEFISDVSSILEKLEQEKKKIEQEEYRRITEIRDLFVKGSKINLRKARKELDSLGKVIKTNYLSGLRSEKRREKRLKKGKAPLGFFLKKLRNDTSLDKQVAGKSLNSDKDTRKEHALAGEVDFLIKLLNNDPKEETIYIIKQKIDALLNDYEKELTDFMNIEIDIEIEEARKLHRIDHYIKALEKIKKSQSGVSDFDELIVKLKDLRKRAKVWVYQDTIDAKKLVNYAKSMNYGLSLLKSSSADDIPGIKMDPSPIGNQVPGTLIYQQEKSYSAGVIVMHGILGNRDTMNTFCKRIASQGYMVYNVDMSAHGESRGNFRLGRNSEYLLDAARWFRLNGIKKVAAVGHSAGSTSILFALCGYNQRMETEFYNLVTDLMKKLVEIGNTLKKSGKSREEYEKAKYQAALLSEEYKKLKQLILSGLERAYKEGSKIDAAVLLAAPLTFQAVFPQALSRVLKKTAEKIPFFTKHVFGKGFTKVMKLIFKHDYGNLADKSQMQAGYLVTDAYDFFNYLEEVKNPYDFMNCVKYFARHLKNKNREYEELMARLNNVESNMSGEKREKAIAYFKETLSAKEENLEFINYYWNNIIKKTPKLFVFGMNDEVLKPFKNNNMRDLEDHYRDMRATEIIKYPNVSHCLIREAKKPVAEFEGGRLPDLTYKVVTFLNNHVGRGRLVPKIEH